MFFTGDIPPRPAQVTRHLAEHLMAQVENPANLDRWPIPSGRLITMIRIRCGLRASDASLLRRLEAATERIRRLEHDNRELREALAAALGEQRQARVVGSTTTRDTPGRTAPKLIGPC